MAAIAEDKEPIIGGPGAKANPPPVYYGLPREVKFCASCSLSNQRPNSCVEYENDDSKKQTIAFDVKNICDACKTADMKAGKIDWEARDKELREICDKYRRNDGRYDVIVPSSGGKDSTMAACLLKYKYGMHPLTVTWAPHIYTEVGFRNFQRAIHAGFDNQLFTPNGKVHRLLTRLAFENLLHPFQPFILGQKNLGAKMSVLYDVPLVMYGENEAEYGNPSGDNLLSTRDTKFHAANMEGIMDMMLSGVKVSTLIEEYGIDLADLRPYLPSSFEETARAKTTVRYMGYYIRWDPQEAYYFSVDNTGFEANPERTEGSYSKYNSLDDRIDGFHYYTTYIKFGIGRTTYDSSQEVRNKKITREEAVALIKKYDGEFPYKYFLEIMEYIGYEPEDFFDLVDTFRSPHLWEKRDGKWFLKHTIYGEEKEDDSRKYADPEFKFKSHAQLFKMRGLDE